MVYIRRNLAAALPLVVSVVSACSDSTSPYQSPPPPGPGTDVTIAFCAGNEPSWVAFQDGDGAWTQAQATTNGSRITFKKTFNSDRGAVAMARVFPRQLSAVSVQYGKPEELAMVNVTNPLICGGGQQSLELLGSVAGLGADDEAQIAAGLNLRTAAPRGGEDSFSLGGLTPGPQEILASRVTRLDPNTTVVTRLILRRLGALPDGTTLPVFDFNSAESFAPSTGTVTIAGIGPEGAMVNTLLLTAHSRSVISFDQHDMSAATRSYLALPETKLDPGDLQILSANSGPVSTEDFRATALYFRAPNEQTLTLGPIVTRPTFSTVATTPTLRLRAQFVNQDEYDRNTSVVYQQGETLVFAVGMTAAYAALTGTGYDIVIPDLSQAAGFDPAWALHAGTTVIWTVNRIGGTLGLGLDAVPSEGTVSRNAVSFGTIPNN